MSRRLAIRQGLPLLGEQVFYTDPDGNTFAALISGTKENHQHGDIPLSGRDFAHLKVILPNADFDNAQDVPHDPRGRPHSWRYREGS